MTEITGIKACVFDAYGTLFDVNAAAAHLKDKLGGKDAKLGKSGA
jgi:FMN phosphatase YigB (HAD superfamily)